MIIEPKAPNLILRLIWFIFVGWWLGGVLSAVAWFLNATIIGLPVGLWIINRLPTFITLRPQDRAMVIDGGVVVYGKEQRPFLVRAIYFLLIGWWFSAIWMVAAYFLVVTVVGLPIAFWMYGRIGAVTTLFRS
jgi:uncharacterized membrane protein YccF (DUF307 family)